MGRRALLRLRAQRYGLPCGLVGALALMNACVAVNVVPSVLTVPTASMKLPVAIAGCVVLGAVPLPPLYVVVLVNTIVVILEAGLLFFPSGVIVTCVTLPLEPVIADTVPATP